MRFSVWKNQEKIEFWIFSENWHNPPFELQKQIFAKLHNLFQVCQPSDEVENPKIWFILEERPFYSAVLLRFEQDSDGTPVIIHRSKLVGLIKNCLWILSHVNAWTVLKTKCATVWRKNLSLVRSLAILSPLWFSSSLYPNCSRCPPWKSGPPNGPPCLPLFSPQLIASTFFLLLLLFGIWHELKLLRKVTTVKWRQGLETP